MLPNPSHMSVLVISTVTSCPAPLMGGLEDCHVQKLFRELSALDVMESPACGGEKEINEAPHCSIPRREWYQRALGHRSRLTFSSK